MMFDTFLDNFCLSGKCLFSVLCPNYNTFSVRFSDSVFASQSPALKLSGSQVGLSPPFPLWRNKSALARGLSLPKETEGQLGAGGLGVIDGRANFGGGGGGG